MSEGHTIGEHLDDLDERVRRLERRLDVVRDNAYTRIEVLEKMAASEWAKWRVAAGCPKCGGASASDGGVEVSNLTGAGPGDSGANPDANPKYTGTQHEFSGPAGAGAAERLDASKELFDHLSGRPPASSPPEYDMANIYPRRPFTPQSAPPAEWMQANAPDLGVHGKRHLRLPNCQQSSPSFAACVPEASDTIEGCPLCGRLRAEGGPCSHGYHAPRRPEGEARRWRLIGVQPIAPHTGIAPHVALYTGACLGVDDKIPVIELTPEVEAALENAKRYERERPWFKAYTVLEAQVRADREKVERYEGFFREILAHFNLYAGGDHDKKGGGDRPCLAESLAERALRRPAERA